MRKKLTFPLILVLTAVLAMFGLNAFAFGSPGSGSSEVLNGTIVKLEKEDGSLTVKTADEEQKAETAKSVWVYRNEQKASLSDLQVGDQVEVILNNKGQAAYIKAYSAATTPAGAADASAAPTSPPAQTSAQATPTPAPTPTATPAAPTTTPAASTGSPILQSPYPGLEGLELKVNGKHFILEIKQNEGNGNVKYDLNIKSEGSGNVHLKGEEAAQWIASLLSSVNLKAQDAEQQLLTTIGQQYGIDVSGLHVKLQTDWDDAKEASSKTEEKEQEPNVTNVQQQQKASVDRDDDDDEDQAEDQDKDDDHGNKAQAAAKVQHGNSAAKQKQAEHQESKGKNGKKDD